MVADGLQVDDFGDFELGWGAAMEGAGANEGGEVAHAAVEFGDENAGSGGVCGRVDEDGGGLPLAGSEGGGIHARGYLDGEGLGVVELAGDVADFGDGAAGQARQLVLLVGGKGVGEVDDDHGWVGSQAAMPMPMAVLRPMPA